MENGGKKIIAEFHADKKKKKAFWISEACHKKVKMLALKDNMTIEKWVEWAIGKGYEALLLRK